MAKNLKPSGFGDYSPEKQILLDKIKEIIWQNYKKYWFVNIETPSVENISVLKAKGWDEVAKQVYGLFGLANWSEDSKKYALHFDLTVPFARYTIEYEEEIKFPFKRQQIQKVFRWERPQKGRYREFYQCDIDTIWENLSTYYDVEIIETLYNTMTNILDFLDLKNKPIVHLNNKYFIEAIIEKFNIENGSDFFKLLDNFYKLKKTDFENKLNQLSPKNYLEILNILKNDLKENIKIFSNSKQIEKIIELKNIKDILEKRWVNVVFDPYITRWLDYYTWVVFETFIEDNVEFGSVCSGWRYDNLVDSIRKSTNSKWREFEWVGWSIWLSRLFSLFEEAWYLEKKLNLTDIIIFNLWCSENYREKIINLLKNTNKSFDVYYNKAKLDKQFKYAENKNIKYWIFAWESEENSWEIIIKNLEKRTEEKIKLNDLKNYFK